MRLGYRRLLSCAGMIARRWTAVQKEKSHPIGVTFSLERSVLLAVANQAIAGRNGVISWSPWLHIDSAMSVVGVVARQPIFFCKKFKYDIQFIQR